MTHKDSYCSKTINNYDQQLADKYCEHDYIIHISLKNMKKAFVYTYEDDIRDDEIISLATAHYEATTNSAFLIHLIANNTSDYEDVLVSTLQEIEHQLNLLSNKVHARDINFVMVEVPKTDHSLQDINQQAVTQRQQLLLSNGFERQSEIDYIHPNYSKIESPFKVDLFINSNIELTKDIYPASVKSDYILKYVFA
ncbi:hypothetical protein, partial [Staphylococcus haemolyticus]|uniref:hypothetical protein n=1 Tax=Staphylococcus haemolyticus TaxID=1283 RepID=UPI0035201DF3